jgi:multisubunit Na+/H+ antiporter MnhB subunit
MKPGRSLILDVGVRAVFHTVLLLSLFLLLAGHNAPGGGFVGGLVAGCAFVLRDVADGFESTARDTIFEPETLIGAGLLLAAATGFGGLLFGGEFLETAKGTVDLPAIGTAKATTALLFDVGVYIVVLGVVLTIGHQLGEEPEQ